MTLSVDPTIRRQVVAAARSLLTAQPEASIGRIASEAGVSRATFYRHFGSRDALLAAVEVEPPVPARDRILEAAADLLGRGGLHGFSMEELAVAAGVSRATVYRLFRRDQSGRLHCEMRVFHPDYPRRLMAQKLNRARHQLRNQVDEIDLAIMGVTQ